MVGRRCLEGNFEFPLSSLELVFLVKFLKSRGIFFQQSCILICRR